LLFHSWLRHTPALQAGQTAVYGQSSAVLRCSFLLAPFPCSSAGPSHRLQSFRINLLQHGLSTGCSMDICPGMGLCTGCQAIPAPPQSLSELQGNSCSGAWTSSYPFSRSQGSLSLVSPSFLSLSNVLPFLTRTLPRRCHGGRGAGLCPAAGLLEPAGTSPSHSSQRNPPQPPGTHTPYTS